MLEKYNMKRKYNNLKNREICDKHQWNFNAYKPKTGAWLRHRTKSLNTTICTKLSAWIWFNYKNFPVVNNQDSKTWILDYKYILSKPRFISLSTCVSLLACSSAEACASTLCSLPNVQPRTPNPLLSGREEGSGELFCPDERPPDGLGAPASPRAAPGQGAAAAGKQPACPARSAGEVQLHSLQHEYVESSSKLTKSVPAPAEGTKPGTSTGVPGRSVMGDGVEEAAKPARGTSSETRHRAHDANLASSN